ncbi:hypothetical protein FF1_045533 [Malus domestica]
MTGIFYATFRTVSLYLQVQWMFFSPFCPLSLLTKQALSSCFSINFAAGVGTISVFHLSMPSLKPRAFPNSIRKHIFGLPKASVAVKQQTQKFKFALIKRRSPRKVNSTETKKQRRRGPSPRNGARCPRIRTMRTDRRRRRQHPRRNGNVR